MAQTSWPFENIDTTEVQFSQWARHINEGIRPDFANELEPFADDSGLNVKVKSGQAMVRGHYYASTAEETLTITTPDATNPRIDSVVLELDIVANSILLKVVAGTPDASPVAPTLTQSEDGNVYQFLLGNVAVAAGVFSIAAGDVTDLRTYMFQGVGKWTTATRPANPIDYQTIGYNTDLNTHEVWNGTAWTSVFAPITTEGDLAIGDNTGTAVRLPIGAADTVLTSNGTTAVWAEASGGAGQSFVVLENDQYSTVNVNFASNSIVRFTLASTLSTTLDVTLFDSSDAEVTTISVSRNTPFTYFTNSTAIAKIIVLNDSGAEAVLVFSNPSSYENPDAKTEAQLITTTQSVTLSNNFDAYVWGGGGGGGGGQFVNPDSFGGGGGGAGFFSQGILNAGTYTATIGAGGSGAATGTGSTGGTTSIGALSAAGGNGATSGVAPNAGNGGNGGSGGGGGASSGGTYGNGGADGANGGDATIGGTGGTGSTVSLPQDTFFEQDLFTPASTTTTRGAGGGLYAGGAGGATSNSSLNKNATLSGGGGGGSGSNSNRDNGGTGGGGFIVLIERA